VITQEKTKLQRADFPEQVGVSSRDILAFIEDLKQSDIEAHSIMVLRHGKVAFETWRDPYGPDIPHTAYSISKSFTATAAGFAIEEGYFQLDTKLIDIFPEFRPTRPDAKLEKVTIRHLLTMSAGKDVSLFADKSKNQWKKDFFDAKWYADPDDRRWKYISENIYMVCAAIQRTTGQTVTEFLTPRLYEPLGFSKIPFWETDSEGLEAGGWGMFLTTEDIAKFIRCYHQGGMLDGKQIIPEWWAREAVKKQGDSMRYHEKDSCAGYCCCFWRNAAVPNSYRADGMFSQFGIVFEDYDAEFIITSCEINEQKTRDCIWRHFPAAFCGESGDRSQYEALKPKMFLEPLKELPAKPHSPLESKLENYRISIKKPRMVNMIGFPVSMLSLATVYMSTDRAGNIDGVEFSFSGDECTMTWNEGDVRNTVICGMDGEARNSPIHLGGVDFTARCSAAWKDERTLEVWFRPLESVCQRRWTFQFLEDGRVTAAPQSMPETKGMLEHMGNTAEDLVKGKAVAAVGREVLKRMHTVVESVHKGRLVSK